MLFRYVLVAIVTAVSSANGLALETRQQDYPCTNGVFVLVARGTDPASTNPLTAGPNYKDLQGMQDVAQAVVNKAGKGSYYRALPYAASPGLNYFTSIAYGTDLGQKIVKEYVDRCKASVTPKIILMGYSQGGQVMTSVLIGGSGKGNLDAYKQYIKGGAFFASPSFVAGYPIDGGNSTTSGTFARTPADYKYFSDTYSNRIRSYCQAGDQFCANNGGLLAGADAQRIHAAGVTTYKQQATQYLLNLV